MALNKRNERQNAIRQIIRDETLFTQRDLVNALKERGHVCTQATVSRDIAEMNLHKMSDGGYVLSEDLYLQRMISELVVDVNRQATWWLSKLRSAPPQVSQQLLMRRPFLGFSAQLQAMIPFLSLLPMTSRLLRLRLWSVRFEESNKRF